jgi:hypothetical protein
MILKVQNVLMVTSVRLETQVFSKISCGRQGEIPYCGKYGAVATFTKEYRTRHASTRLEVRQIRLHCGAMHEVFTAHRRVDFFFNFYNNFLLLGRQYGHK